MTLANGFILAVFGAILALFYNVYLARVREKISFINDCVQAIDRIEKLAVAYWLAAGRTTYEEELVSAAELRGALSVTSTFEATIFELCGTRSDEYLRLDGILFDEATGIAFEQACRDPDPAQAIRVMQACNGLRGFLRAERPKQYWVR